MNEHAHVWDSIPRRWLYGVVLVLTAFTFGSTLTFEFVYDDHWTLLGNGFLRDPANLAQLLSPSASKQHVPDAFRPTLVVFDLLSYQLLGLSKVGHHAVSVLLHVAVTGLFGAWIASEGAPRRIVVTAMTLFGVLAIHGEAIAVVSYREDLLAAGLGLGALLLASESARRSTVPKLVGATVLMTLACGAKLSAAPLPLVWLLAQRLGPWRAPTPRRAFVWPAVGLFAGVFAFVALRIFVLGGIDPYGETERVFANRVGMQPVLAASAQIHLGYLQQLFVPRGFSPEYVDYAARWSDPATLCALGALGGLASVAIASWRRRRAPAVAWVIFATFLLLGPTSNFAPMPTMRADRFMYLPSLPVCVGMAALLLRIGDSLRTRFDLHPLLPWILMIVAQGSMSQGVTAAYRSDSRLWQIAVRRAPHSARAHAVIGEQLTARLLDRPHPSDQPAVWVRARTHCVRAMQLDPRSDLPHLCRARLAAAERGWERSYQAFDAALAHSGVRRDRAMVALASTSMDLPALPYEARIQRAKIWLAQARSEYPYVAEVFAVSGRLRHRSGDAAGAEADYRRASDLHPERWDVVLAGVELQLDLGHASAAATAWSAARPRLDEAPVSRLHSVQRRLRTAQRLSTPSSFPSPR